MPLFDTGERTDALNGDRARAVDELGRQVVVTASYEAVQDKGWEAIFSAASAKFDRGDYDKSGALPIVRITTAEVSGGRGR